MIIACKYIIPNANIILLSFRLFKNQMVVENVIIDFY